MDRLRRWIRITIASGCVIALVFLAGCPPLSRQVPLMPTIIHSTGWFPNPGSAKPNPTDYTWSARDCTGLDPCNFEITVGPSKTSDAHDCEVSIPAYVLDVSKGTTRIAWSLKSSVADKKYKFGWDSPKRPGIRVFDSPLPFIPDDDTVTLAAPVGPYTPASGSSKDTSGTSTIDTNAVGDPSNRRAFYYRIYVTQTDADGSSNAVRCNAIGPVIINRG
jgi:hypothetical protein